MASKATVGRQKSSEKVATDGAHPSIAGSYLAACVFVCLLSGEPLDDAPYWPDAITEADALALQEMAEQTVFE